MNDPSGSYDGCEVTLVIAGVPITKGNGAGVFVHVGPRGVPHKRSRVVTVTLSRGSPLNEHFLSWSGESSCGSVRMHRLRDGAVFLSTGAYVDDCPRNVGTDERSWDVVCGLNPDEEG
jgi:hypothetical protein